jgi:hypothetical protein
MQVLADERIAQLALRGCSNATSKERNRKNN